MKGRAGPDSASMPGTTGLGRGERETRGEHRGRGERLPSGSRFVFPVPLLLLSLVLLLVLPRSAAAQSDSTQFPVEGARGLTFGVRLSGIYSTRLMSDDIAFSRLPDTAGVIQDRFRRDTVFVRMGIAPDVTVTAGLDLAEETTVLLAAGYTFGQLEVQHAEVTRDAGAASVGHAVLSVQKPVRGYLGRFGAGVLWMHGGDVAAVEGVRAINPLFELALGKRWPVRGFEVDAALAAQAAQMTSDAIEVRGGQAGFVYRLGVELGLSRRFGR